MKLLTVRNAHNKKQLTLCADCEKETSGAWLVESSRTPGQFCDGCAACGAGRSEDRPEIGLTGKKIHGGYVVEDSMGGIWWPQGHPTACTTARAALVLLAISPMSGEWRT